MPKSIHERVRAALEKKEREAQRVGDRQHDKTLRREEREAADYERGLEWALEGNWTTPCGASASFRDGFRAGVAAETREMLGD